MPTSAVMCFLYGWFAGLETVQLRKVERKRGRIRSRDSTAILSGWGFALKQDWCIVEEVTVDFQCASQPLHRENFTYK